MNDSFVSNVGTGFFPNKEENVMTSIFKEYEKVIIESLITSFGLDFLLNDRHGGDVDTILNVRKIGKDSQMTYKNKINEETYNNLESYNSHEYHSHKNYVQKNKEVKSLREQGLLKDGYTGEKLSKSDLDHIVSAKSIHCDRGRVLSGLKGTDLANSNENLKATNPRTNRTKKADTMSKFLGKYGDEYTESQKKNMNAIYNNAEKSYDRKINIAYYTSSNFSKDLTSAATNVGIRMGIRQALGLVFTEIWFSIKEEFKNFGNYFDLKEVLNKIGTSIKRAFEKAKVKYKEIFSKFLEGSIAGAISSIVTTLCNIFFTTAKNVVTIIRQTWVSVVQAAKILFINPDNLPFGERMRAVVKILSIGASVVVGVLVNEAISKTPISAIPIAGDIIQTFCGTLVTGIMSCTLLYFLDRNEKINKLVSYLNNLTFFGNSVNYFRQQAEYFEKYAAELMNIDLNAFKREAKMYDEFAIRIKNAQNNPVELNRVLRNILETIGVRIPWDNNGENKSFDSFMRDKNSRLVFK